MCIVRISCILVYVESFCRNQYSMRIKLKVLFLFILIAESMAWIISKRSMMLMKYTILMRYAA